jgi:hypothetical protein
MGNPDGRRLSYSSTPPGLVAGSAPGAVRASTHLGFPSRCASKRPVPERDTPTSLAGQVSDFVATTKSYAKQETLGPLKHAGRFLAFGLAGAVLLSIGAVLTILGALRLLQTHNDGWFNGNETWIPYLLILVVIVVVIGLCGWRITKHPLHQKGPK